MNAFHSNGGREHLTLMYYYATAKEGWFWVHFWNKGQEIVLSAHQEILKNPFLFFGFPIFSGWFRYKQYLSGCFKWIYSDLAGSWGDDDFEFPIWNPMRPFEHCSFFWNIKPLKKYKSIYFNNMAFFVENHPEFNCIIIAKLETTPHKKNRTICMNTIHFP